MYRKTKAYGNQCAKLARMRAKKERKRIESESPDYPIDLPDLRMRITVERFDFGEESHVFELKKTKRVDSYAVYVDGEPWKVCGLSKVLEGLRKASPRVLSDRRI